MLTYEVTRGRHRGRTLVPHVQDGHHVVSRTRFEKDYVKVPVGEPLEPYLRRGFSLRMGLPDGSAAPSLISPVSIKGWTR